MFTGIIQQQVKILRKVRQGKSIRLMISMPEKEDRWEEGESISINGICLSLEKTSPHTLYFYAQEETTEKTTLKALKTGDTVNMERALKFGHRVGGHLVQGHVDETGRIIDRKRKGKSFQFEISASSSLMRYIIYKGSVAVDGISLTVSCVKKTGFTVDVIPLTLESTNIRASWKTGKYVNIESDALNRQIYKSVEHILSNKK